MNKFIAILLISIVFSACKQTNKSSITVNEQVKLDSAFIATRLQEMKGQDQAIMMAHKPNETKQVRDSLFKEQERIIKANTDSLKQLFLKYGYLGIDDVGEKAAQSFWLLVQHADHDKDFQKQVLDSMIIEVEKGYADPTNYALLKDRVLINDGRKQLYGTQVRYQEDFWAISKPLKDSAKVNERRLKLGLNTLEECLNDVMEMHYQMNTTIYQEAGLLGPRKYDLD